ncbi:MAG: hypothetical protein Q9166_003344 [cf. Caloplaca sp. 2 TL-2023]
MVKPSPQDSQEQPWKNRQEQAGFFNMEPAQLPPPSSSASDSSPPQHAVVTFDIQDPVYASFEFEGLRTTPSLIHPFQGIANTSYPAPNGGHTTHGEAYWQDRPSAASQNRLTEIQHNSATILGVTPAAKHQSPPVNVPAATGHGSTANAPSANGSAANVHTPTAEVDSNQRRYPDGVVKKAEGPSQSSATIGNMGPAIRPSKKALLEETINEGKAFFEQRHGHPVMVRGALANLDLLLDFAPGGYYSTRTFLFLQAITEIPEDVALIIEVDNLPHILTGLTDTTTSVILVSSGHSSGTACRGHWILVHANLRRKFVTVYGSVATGDQSVSTLSLSEAYARAVNLIRDVIATLLRLDTCFFDSVYIERDYSSSGCDGTSCGPLTWRNVENLLGRCGPDDVASIIVRISHCQEVVQALKAFGAAEMPAIVDELQSSYSRKRSFGRDLLEPSLSPCPVKKPRVQAFTPLIPSLDTAINDRPDNHVSQHTPLGGHDLINRGRPDYNKPYSTDVLGITHEDDKEPPSVPDADSTKDYLDSDNIGTSDDTSDGMTHNARTDPSTRRPESSRRRRLRLTSPIGGLDRDDKLEWTPEDDVRLILKQKYLAKKFSGRTTSECRARYAILKAEGKVH